MAEHFERGDAAQEPGQEPARPKAAQSEAARPEASQTQDKELSRRGFLKTTAVAAAGAALGSRLAQPAHAQATAGAAGGQVGAAVNQNGPVPQGPRLRVGLIGCGGRGTGAVGDCLSGAPNMEVWALGDLFGERVNGTRGQLMKDHKEKVNITDARMFTGFDCYQKVIGSGVDLVILATPPGFRPIHLRAAVDAGKHVFMEKPVAVDATGVRSVIESGEIAARKNLGIVSGTQRRHQASYIETIKRIHRQQDGTDSRVGENIVGTLGRSDPGGWIRGKNTYRHEGGNNPYVQEHTNLVNSIRRGQPLNEARRIAESTLTAIMGRMSAYTGKQVSWEQAMNSKENLMPANLDLKMSLPTPPIAIPGKTPLI